MRATDAIQLHWTAAGTSGPYNLSGGTYAVVAHSASWGGGNAQLQVLGPDDATWLNVGSDVTQDGITTLTNLPPGEYQIVVTTTTAGWINVVRVPGD